MFILALMSGSSLDGLDIGLISLSEGPSYEILKATTIPYTPFWLEKLPTIASATAMEFFELEALYSSYIAELVRDFLDSASIEVDCISFHGHTITHQVRQGYSIQFGNGGIIASKTGKKTLVDFRTGDMAKGGQGAPLMAIVDRDFFSGYCASINLGGICNISCSYLNSSVAYDMGPCNQLLNAAARVRNQEMDLDGKLAEVGKSSPTLLKYFEADPYLQDAWPKSLDNREVRDYYLKSELFESHSAEDFARTSCVFIAQLISKEIDKLNRVGSLDPLLRQVLFTGGGCHHKVLWTCIEQACSEKNLLAFKPSSEVIDYKELLLMAYLAYLRLNNKYNILSEYTGASSNTMGGAVYEP